MGKRMWALALAWCLLTAGAGRAAELSRGLPDGAMVEGVPVELTAVSALLMEVDSGQIIFEKNADERRAVASVVKIMTILLVIEAVEDGRIALTDEVTVSPNAAGMGGSQVLLDAGEKQTVDVLLKSAVVGSANDAAVALAEHMDGAVSAFVQRMNDRARALGMMDTHFVNATGLPAEGQYTTARDVAVMARALFSHPMYYRYSTVWMDEVIHESGRATSLTNTNRLIRLYDGCDGGKTGSTGEAGYCLAATAKRGEMRLLAVVLGASSGKERFSEAAGMLDYGFAGFRRYQVAREGERVRGEMPVAGGAAPGVELALAEDFTVLLRKGEEGGIELVPHLPDALTAPVRAGEIVGSVDVMQGERLLRRVAVAAVADVPRAGFSHAFSRVRKHWGVGT